MKNKIEVRISTPCMTLLVVVLLFIYFFLFLFEKVVRICVLNGEIKMYYLDC